MFYHGRADLPRVSIITPSYNQAQFLEETVLSVISQDYPHIEYIVIDGGSSDGSVDIIRKYENRLAYWVSEPDRGQAHAINKGWRRATGDIVAYLNADDVYTPDAITAAVRALLANPEACMVYSDALFINEHGKIRKKYKAVPFDIHRTIESNDGFIPQATAFIRGYALDSIGLLDEGLHMVMDYDLWVRLGLRYPVTFLPGVYLAKVREHSSAKSTAAVDRFPIERRQVLNKVFSRNDLPVSIRDLRLKAYGHVAFMQAILAGRSGQPDRILSPLLHAMAGCPSSVARTPLTYYLIVRSLVPWWKGKPSLSSWYALDRIVESLRT